MKSSRVKEIVVTGGPCAGKSQGLQYVAAELWKLGVRAFVVPEIPTEYITRGVPDIVMIKKNKLSQFCEIERQILLGYMARRQEYHGLASVFAHESCVILFDRGPMDIAAYIPNSYFEDMLYDERLTYFEARDSFDAVIHLVTAANGAEEFYTTDNNDARYETLAEARLSDDKTLRAWLGHPHLKIIDNSTDFEEKKKRLLRAVLKALGTPVPVEIERRFLLKNLPDFLAPPLRNAPHFLIEQMYLVLPGGEKVRIRKRSQGNYSHHSKTVKRPLTERSRIEEEVDIGAVAYRNLSVFKDPNSTVIRKHRTYFLFNNQYFELDIFQVHAAGLAILEIELTEECDVVELPRFLSIEREITGEPHYSNYEIAKQER